MRFFRAWRNAFSEQEMYTWHSKSHESAFIRDAAGYGFVVVATIAIVSLYSLCDDHEAEASITKDHVSCTWCWRTSTFKNQTEKCWSLFHYGMTGPGGFQDCACLRQCTDMDEDGDVDLKDYARYQTCIGRDDGFRVLKKREEY